LGGRGIIIGALKGIFLFLKHAFLERLPMYDCQVVIHSMTGGVDSLDAEKEAIQEAITQRQV